MSSSPDMPPRAGAKARAGWRLRGARLRVPRLGRPRRHRMRIQVVLIGTAVAVLLYCATSLSIASQRITAEQASYGAPATVQTCTPEHLNESALLPGTPLSVSPLPGARDASPGTQVSLLGAPASAISRVSVTGSLSGAHSGRLEAYSQGDGASFVPAHPFLPGERVTVKGAVAVSGRTQRFAFHFYVDAPDDHLFKAVAPPPKAEPGQLDHFQSAPALDAPSVYVDARSSLATGGDVFAAPYNGPGPSGPMIFDEEGNLVWFDPLPAQVYATNLQVQQYGAERVLTWWQGHIPPAGFGEGEEIVDNQSYHRILVVHAGNGYTADLHDFHLTGRGTALLTVFEPIECNISSMGGPRHAAVTNSGFQEVDLATGLVRREWLAIDHVPLSDSYSSATGASDAWPFDFFHINSIDQLSDGDTLISARNTWSMYELSTQTGQVITEIGGKQSNYKLATGAATAFQHDATVLGNGTVSVFDNGGVPNVHPQSRALLLSLNASSKTDSVLAQFEHPSPPLSAGSQGNVQMLEDGDLFIGWGAQPWFSEFNTSDQLLFDAHWKGTYESYRAYRFNWTGSPGRRPSVAATRSSKGAVTVYASWNGDTRTVTWKLYAGSSTKNLKAVGEASRTGFETSLTAPSSARYFAVQAIGAHGEALGSSAQVKA